MAIKVSVILPSYNVANYIEQCIKSVLLQTLDDIEILCVDAGSTDGTIEIIEKLAEYSSSIRIIRSEKKSYGYQMNIGIKEARGEYVGIVETDDYIDSDMFETLYNRASKCDADMVKGVLYDVYETKKGLEKEILSDYIPTRYLTDIVFSPDEDPEVHNWDGNIWNGIYKRQFLLNHNIWFQETPGASFQDIAFQQMVLNEAEKVCYIHAHFYHYRKLRIGASTWNPKCVRFVCDAYRSLFSDKRIKQERKKYIYYRFITAFLYEFRKALCISGYEIEKIEYPEGVEWFNSQLRSAIDEEIITYNDLDEVNRDELDLFLTDIDKYVREWKEQAEALYKLLAQIKSGVGDGKLIVLGVGRYGHLLICFLIYNGITIDGLVDNQKVFQNTSYYDIKVQSVSDSLRKKEDQFYLVSSKKAGQTIREQLIKLGVKEDKIMLLDSENKSLINGLKKNPIMPER